MIPVTCGDYARVLFTFAREAAGALGTGIPCALYFLGERFLQHSDASRRGNAESYLKLERRHCEEHSDEANRPPSFRDGAPAPDPESRDSGFDASHRPGMTAFRIASLARNDERRQQ